jgi:hypothetical protein
MEQTKIEALRALLSDVDKFSRGLYPRQRLRQYQQRPARALIDAVRAGEGGFFVWVFSRQAGKDETLAQVLAYLLNLYQLQGGQIVVAAPTLRQATISRDRLLSRMDNALNKGRVKENGYIVKLGRCNARFLSAAPTSNARGETASLLLVCNETQDVLSAQWDAVFDPMAASTNAVTLFLGTVWTNRTLLARQMRFCRELELQDGKQRIFSVDWHEVAAELPAYGERVKARIIQFGADHPFIRTEYELKELEGNGGLFNRERMSLMQGGHVRLAAREKGTNKVYCLLIDVAGGEEEENGDIESRANSKRDSTVVTVVEVADALAGSLPRYQVVHRYQWTNVAQTALHSRIVGLAADWAAKYVVVDSTGIGAGLASFLEKSLPRRVLPFQFTSSSKSELGWNFLAIVDSGRYKEYSSDGADDTALFWRQLEAVEYEVRPGPGKLMKWSVLDPALHDDLVLSASLVAVLDGQDWRSRKAVGVQPGY